MPIEDNKYQKVRPGGESKGEWLVVIHDCQTPSLDEIRQRKAAVGTIWKCEGDSETLACGDRWKLITRGNNAFSGTSELHWVRITSHPDNDEE